MSTISSRFTDLPQELKDQVFQELWIQDGHLFLAPVSLQYHAPDNDKSLIQILLDYDKPHPQNRYKKVLPKWLLTNKATYDKGLKQLLSKATLSWQEHLHLGATPKKMPWLDMHTAGAFTFRFDFYKWSPRIHNLEPYPWVDKHIQHVVQRLSLAIQTLNFTSKYYFSEYRFYGSSLWIIDLPVLNAQLDNL
jgi:hypothetical protein